MGKLGLFEEKQVGAERFNIFSEYLRTKTAIIILREGAEQFIEEAERSMNDAIMVVISSSKSNTYSKRWWIYLNEIK